MRQGTFTIGMDATVCWDEPAQAFVVAFQVYGTTRLQVWTLQDGVAGAPDGILTLQQREVELGAGAKAFPVVRSVAGERWLAYRRGGPTDADHCTVLERNGVVVFVSLPVGGNWPQVCSDDGQWLYYQRVDRSVWRRRLAYSPFEPVEQVRPPGWGVPTGLWRVREDGTIVTSDDAFLAEPGLARPRWAGRYTVGQPREGHGLIVRRDDGWEAPLWSDETCEPPNLAVSPGGLICVVTNTPKGRPDAVRWALLTDADFAEVPGPGPTPPTEWPVTDPTDVVPYLIGDATDWPRVQVDGHQMHCHVERYAGDRGRAYFIKGTTGTPWEAWGWDAHYIYHLRDHVHDHRGVAYEFSDKRWLPRYATPGDVIDASSNQIRWYRDGAWTAWAPFPYRMTVEAMTTTATGRGRLVFTYDPGGSGDTIERFTCLRGRGWDAWQEIDQRTGAVRQAGHWPSTGGVPVRPAGLLLDGGARETGLQEPGVTIDVWNRELRPGAPWLLNFHDRHNPDLGYAHSVELVPRGDGVWSVHVETRNAAGANRSGMTREVRLAGAEPQPEPEPEPRPVGPLYPYLSEFLAWPDGYAFLYPGWTREKQARYRGWLRVIGGNGIVAPVWADYAGQEGEFDYHDNPGGFAALLAEAWRDGVRACVPLFGDLVEATGWGELSEAEAHRWLRGFLPPLLSALATQGLVADDVLWCTGLEFCQIGAHLARVDPDVDPEAVGYWTWHGTAHLRIGRTIRELIGPTADLASHWPPHRITGYPHYTDHANPPGKDERSWWVDGAGVFTCLLHQRPPDEALRYVVAHTIGGESQDGSHDVGDAVRIVQWYSAGRNRFVSFEVGRELRRNRAIWNALKDSPLVSGSGNIGA